MSSVINLDSFFFRVGGSSKAVFKNGRWWGLEVGRTKEKFWLAVKNKTKTIHTNFCFLAFPKIGP